MSFEEGFAVAISGVRVCFFSESRTLLSRLRNDFAAFPEETLGKGAAIIIRARNARPPAGFSEGAKWRKSRNCRIFDRGAVRWNDYGGEAWVRYDFEGEEAQVYSLSEERLHELCYLVALSRAGKALDMLGVHRIHAMAVASADRVLLLSMPMKGGKTTACLRLLDADRSLEFVSDDSPLVDVDGRVRAFPLRVGLDPENAERHSTLELIDWPKAYALSRMRFGRKILVPINAIHRSVYRKPSGTTVLVTGIRRDQSGARLIRTGVLGLLPTVLRNMVIGDGLPMMREYFIENSPRDFLRCARILFSRLRSGAMLLLRSEKYRIYLGNDHATNVRELQRLLEASK